MSRVYGGSRYSLEKPVVSFSFLSRLRPLVLAVKLWARKHGINEARLQTLSSYTLRQALASNHPAPAGHFCTEFRGHVASSAKLVGAETFWL